MYTFSVSQSYQALESVGFPGEFEGILTMIKRLPRRFASRIECKVPFESGVGKATTTDDS